MAERVLAIDAALAGLRLDAALAEGVEGLTRSRASALIKAGVVRVNGRIARRASALVREGERVEFEVPEAMPSTAEPEAIPLVVLYEDPDLLVVDKPAGLVVHPAQGHWRGTLVNALLALDAGLAAGSDGIRPGIVHRLDRDTSGCLVVARTTLAREGLMAQFRERSVGKTYLAFVRGIPSPEGRIDAPIGRDPRNRKRMSVRSRRGRAAASRWRLLERYRGASLLEVEIETGRTHQIRVHLASLGHPVLGDRLYGAGRRIGAPAEPPRQALHAAELRLRHPRTGAALVVKAALPDDLRQLRERLRNSAGEASQA